MVGIPAAARRVYEPLMRRALAIDEQSYGAEHPKVRRSDRERKQPFRGSSRCCPSPVCSSSETHAPHCPCCENANGLFISDPVRSFSNTAPRVNSRGGDLPSN